MLKGSDEFNKGETDRLEGNKKNPQVVYIAHTCQYPINIIYWNMNVVSLQYIYIKYIYIYDIYHVYVIIMHTHTH